MNPYIAGDVISTNTTFTNTAGTPIDPTTVTLKYDASNTAPATLTYTGATTPATNVVAKTSTGNYTCWIDTTSLVGYLVYEWQGVGSGQTVNASSAIIYPRPL